MTRVPTQKSDRFRSVKKERVERWWDVGIRLGDISENVFREKSPCPLKDRFLARFLLWGHSVFTIFPYTIIYTKKKKL